MDLFYRHAHELIPWWQSDRVDVYFRSFGWIAACPFSALDLRHATMLEF